MPGRVHDAVFLQLGSGVSSGRRLQPASHLAASYEAGLLEHGLALAEHDEVRDALHTKTRRQFGVALGVDF